MAGAAKAKTMPGTKKCWQAMHKKAGRPCKKKTPAGATANKCPGQALFFSGRWAACASVYPMLPVRRPVVVFDLNHLILNVRFITRIHESLKEDILNKKNRKTDLMISGAYCYYYYYL